MTNTIKDTNNIKLNKSLHIMVSAKQHEILRKHAFKSKRTVGDIIRALINNMSDVKTLILVIGFISGFAVLYKIREPELMAYNRHMCAVYGYYEDCKTPLPAGLRLK